jgi:ABC-type Fe3+-citrate transport system substrate-binding protein
MKAKKIWIILFVMCAAVLSLASCSSDDDNKDIVEQVTIFVSAETGTYNVVPGTTLEEGMLI